MNRSDTIIHMATLPGWRTFPATTSVGQSSDANQGKNDSNNKDFHISPCFCLDLFSVPETAHLTFLVIGMLIFLTHESAYIFAYTFKFFCNPLTLRRRNPGQNARAHVQSAHAQNRSYVLSNPLIGRNFKAPVRNKHAL